ncbi:hypothetical protein FGO68_gene9136 [Halteria grandinella]|uniref:t-SNARE coiled-coil homology domain-containing protein n=1 Tax=Halteria grandinella TaxID=5974 RepID=A0A8J8NMB3_HALGN|nr:hypothetical protein FGO68_gene9136 [Halteria grandinella]
MEKTLENFSFKLKSLEKYCEQLGTVQDSLQIRASMNSSLDECLRLMQTAESTFQKLSALQMPITQQKAKDSQMRAFKESFDGFGKRFRNASLEIQRKQNIHPLYSSNDSTTDHGHVEEQKHQAVKQKQKIDNIRLVAETDQMEDHLMSRRQDIDKITNIMQNINMIAKDINIETHAQGETLLRIDRDMGHTAENTTNALKELQMAQLKQKRNYKWVASILIFAIIMLALTIISF